jgi:hypothetical protein
MGHVRDLRARGAKIVVSDEGVFCRSCPPNRFDVVISDADHLHSDQWLDDHLRITKPDGWLFFHDTANRDFPNLANIVARIRDLGLWHAHFTVSSRPEERCERGLLLVRNRKPRFAVFSAWDAGYAELAATTIPNRRTWCERWGYELVTCDRWEEARHPLWAKWKLARDRLPDFDWAFVLDVDAIICNPSRQLRDFLGDTDLLVTADINGVNAGVLLLKNTPWTNALLEKIWNAEPSYRSYPNPEQSALAHLLCAEPKERWAVLPQRSFNSYLYGEYSRVFPEGQYQDGDFILHLPALSRTRRLEIFRGILGQRSA